MSGRSAPVQAGVNPGLWLWSHGVAAEGPWVAFASRWERERGYGR